METEALTDIVYTDDGSYIVWYSKSHHEKSVRAARDVIVSASFVARDWHGGQWSYLYRLQCGDFTYATIVGAASELARAIEKYPVSNDETYDADGMIEAQQALADLEAVTHPDFEA